MTSNQVDFGIIEDLLDKSLLLSGIGGCGKTHALIEISNQLIKNNKSVACIDFRNELLDIVNTEELNSFVSMTNDIVSEEKLIFGFNHIHFGDDMFYAQNQYELDFLTTVAKKVDYLVVDEAHLLTGKLSLFKGKQLKHIYKICEILLEINPTIKFIFTVQNTNYFSKHDYMYFLTICHHQLFFRLSSVKTNKGNQFLLTFGVGEAVLFDNDTPLKYFSFYKKQTQETLDYINYLLT